MGCSVPPIPDSLRENLAYGLGREASERWLEHAAARAEELFEAWGLVPDQVLSGGSESLCVKCGGPDGETVLKIPASIAGGAAEVAALRAWSGDGAARVLRSDPVDNAMLMNFLGWVGAGSYTTAEVVDLADRLHRADTTGHAFPSVDANLARRIGWAADRFAEPGHDRAQADLVLVEKVLSELVYDEGEPVLVHGDLQPKNLIVSDHGLTVVDPLPALGPALFDVAMWLVKGGGERSVSDCLAEVLRLRPDLDADALQRWAWCLAVLESRPYLGARNRHRERFVEDLRSRVA